MSATQITDHIDRIKLLLTEQFKDKPNIEALLNVFATEIQNLENVCFQLINDRALDTAIGEQLDRIGEIVGLPRYSLSDNDYRAQLRIQIQINISSGTPEQIINIVKLLTNADTVSYTEVYPAGVGLKAFGESTIAIENLSNLVERLLPATVSYSLSIVDSNAFAFEDTDPGGPYGDEGFTAEAGEYSEAY